jgi:hypothetical protein
MAMMNGDFEETGPEGVRKSGRVARDAAPTRTAKVIGAAVGAIGAAFGAIGAGKAVGVAESTAPQGQDLLRHESPVPHATVRQAVGALSASDIKADMAEAQQRIEQDPALRSRFETALSSRSASLAGLEQTRFQQRRNTRALDWPGRSEF